MSSGFDIFFVLFPLLPSSIEEDQKHVRLESHRYFCLQQIFQSCQNKEVSIKLWGLGPWGRGEKQTQESIFEG